MVDPWDVALAKLAKPLQQVPPDCATIAMRAKAWGIGYTAANRRLVAMEEAGQVE